MTELEDLEEIAEAHVFGYGGVNGRGVPHPRHRFASEACGAGHPWTEQSTRRYRVGKRIRRVCRICDKLRATERRKAKT